MPRDFVDCDCYNLDKSLLNENVRLHRKTLASTRLRSRFSGGLPRTAPRASATSCSPDFLLASWDLRSSVDRACSKERMDKLK